MTEFTRAESLGHALTLLARPGPETTILAGGTDVLVWVHSGSFSPERVVDVWAIRPQCAEITDNSDHIRIGAIAAYREIIESPLVQEHLPALASASREVGAVQIQNRGTLGGNIGGSSPAGDSLPVLLAYGAEIELQSTGNTRLVPYREYCTGYRETARRPDELITAILVPKPHSTARHGWYKAGTRSAQAISKVMLAGVGRIGDDGAVVECDIAVGSVAPVPLHLTDVRDVVVGKQLTPEVIQAARDAATNQVTPIDDVRSTADYRRTVTGNLVTRYLRMLARP